MVWPITKHCIETYGAPYITLNKVNVYHWMHNESLAILPPSPVESPTYIDTVLMVDTHLSCQYLQLYIIDFYGFEHMQQWIGFLQAKTTKKIVLRMECTECKIRKQLPIKRCKHFELGGDKKRKV